MYTNWLVLVLLLLVQSPMTETREHQPKPPTCTSDGDCKISLHLRSSVCFKGSCFECLNDTNCKKGTYCDSYCDLTTHTCSVGEMDCSSLHKFCNLTNGQCHDCLTQGNCLWFQECYDGICVFAWTKDWWIVALPVLSTVIGLLVVFLVYKKKQNYDYEDFPTDEWEEFLEE
eukprot:TRINITY_DN1711_c0_g1_i2.p1 TRINITY_DN1711_c0_g1~~TRINITY_DN1711_c0_g1_i2.p1  ORF type:complete len:172 (+),score=31.49 TRINITY_DN1711_c0_g1_i2:65-580(+)